METTRDTGTETTQLRATDLDKKPEGEAELKHEVAIRLSSRTHCRRRSRPVKRAQTSVLLAPKVAMRLAVLHTPTSTETRLSHGFLDVLIRVNSYESWVGSVPARIGYNGTVDLAATTLLKASRFNAYQSDACFDDYLRACGGAYRAIMAQLISSPSSDEALVAISVLACSAALLWCLSGLSMSAIYTHHRGVNAIFQQMMRARRSLSPMAVAVSYWNWIGTFHIPVAAGESSPFEDSAFWDTDSALLDGSRADQVRLRRLSHELFIRLPRLITLVRVIRESKEPDSDQYTEAVALAHELALLQDPEMESTLLHNVTICKTPGVPHARVGSLSLRYRSQLQCVTLLYYWQTQIMLGRLCLLLNSLSRSIITPNQQGSDSPLTPATDTQAARYDLTAIETSNYRMARNIIMSWSYAEALGPVRFYLLTIGGVALWGALSDLSAYHGRPVSEAKAWALQRYNDLYHHPAYGEAAMDEAAELLRGGPLRGFLVEMVSPPNA